MKVFHFEPDFGVFVPANHAVFPVFCASVYSSSPGFLWIAPVKTDDFQTMARQTKTPAFVADVKDGYSSISEWPLDPLPT